MSIPYQHILLATDLLPGTKAVAFKARELADLYQARLSAIHIVESVPLYFGNELVLPETQEIELQLLERARNKMSELTESLAIPQEQGVVDLGVTKYGILEFAGKHNVDLIVIGSHSRHGIEHLLGSTARAVVNAASIDVLAVKLKHDRK